MTDLQLLCLRMADELDHYRQLLSDDRREVHCLAVEARAAVAAAADGPAVPEAAGPSDADLHAMAFSYSQPCYQFEYIPFARAVLARWGRPAIATELENAND